jgi:hypothetical protein
MTLALGLRHCLPLQERWTMSIEDEINDLLAITTKAAESISVSLEQQKQRYRLIWDLMGQLPPYTGEGMPSTADRVAKPAVGPAEADSVVLPFRLVPAVPPPIPPIPSRSGPPSLPSMWPRV